MVSSYDDFRNPNHLPNHRRGRAAANPFDLPRQRRGKTPQMHGRYPDYDCLEEADHWDEVTRKTVEARLEPITEYSFFTENEVRTLEPFCDTIMAQGDEPKIPVLGMVDRKLAAGRLDGYRYENMPSDYETWRRVARGLDHTAREQGAESFAELSPGDQVEICERFGDGELSGAEWDTMSVTNAWGVVMRMIISQFYSHPWAWNEIGYGGPSYPRGYMRLGIDQREPYGKPEAMEPDPVSEVREKGLP